jgi:flavin reductase (DIM6/NTAB) family NADH-FMN oxidoreductase RutF
MTQQQTDSRTLRSALGRFATGVAIVTAIDPDGHPIGLTVNSFAAVSLEPALVLWCLDNASHNLEAFRRASHHAINILAVNQEDLSNRFRHLAGRPLCRSALASGGGWCPAVQGLLRQF